MNMRTFLLNKLVHDEIVQAHVEEGGEVDFIELSGDELVNALEEKLLEEQRELEAAHTDEERAKEEEDINNILFALGRLPRENFVPTKTFSKGHFIKTVALPEGNKWSEYYASDPERFREI